MNQMTYAQFLEEIGRLQEIEDAYYDAVGQWEEDTEWWDAEAWAYIQEHGIPEYEELPFN